MKAQFKKFLYKNLNIKEEEKILLTISGGIDSMVMVKLFSDIKHPFGIAHCNFKLRGKDSDEDEIFVKKTASRLNIPFFTISFDTNAYAKKKKVSIQMAARELRYRWFEEIRKSNDYTYTATAHHLSDSVETILYNFAKGTGIRGLRGILQKKDKLIRPILFATKNEILAFAKKNQIEYREDVSNSSVKYSRNFIRHKIIPLFKELNPSFEKSIANTSRHLHETEQLLNFFIKKTKKEIVTEEGKFLNIDIKKLLDFPTPTTLLYELISEYGFNSSQVGKIIEATEEHSGKIFESTDYQLIIDRKFFILKKKNKVSNKEFFLNKNDERLKINDKIIEIKILTKPPDTFQQNNNFAFLDLRKINFPIKIRHWKKGDYFYPLGMKGKRKKLQDFFSDNKLSIFEKEEVLIMESDKKICWIIGHRIDERFKITDFQNSKVLMLKVKDS